MSSSYNGQYPPLHPRSPADISSFTELHTSLRQSLPELAREGDKILNEEQLSKFVDGLVRFQKEHLGRVSYYSCYFIILVSSVLVSFYFDRLDCFYSCLIIASSTCTVLIFYPTQTNYKTIEIQIKILANSTSTLNSST